MNEVFRPDPDALLAQMRSEEARAQRGKLRIYFGASAGLSLIHISEPTRPY